MNPSPESKPTEPVYSTRRVGEVQPDGTWVAELSVNGKPYTRVDVGSISALLARHR
jgi:hypothetical protein